MLPHYYTVKGNGQTEIIIQKSRFLAHAARTETEEAAQNFIESIKKEHWNATHNCSAYLIGENDQVQKANDDGEPSGTAGVPILEVLKKKKLKNTTVVITRYFGGIKLGAGGLIRAYGKAASEGIKAAGTVERILMKAIHAKVDYTWLGKLENEIRSSAFSLKEIHYLDKVNLEVLVEENLTDNYKEWITGLTNGQAEFEEAECVYLEKTIDL